MNLPLPTPKAACELVTTATHPCANDTHTYDNVSEASLDELEYPSVASYARQTCREKFVDVGLQTSAIYSGNVQ
jgi:hypothetical protein